MLFVGDGWAEDHHDVEIVAGDGRRLARRRLPEGVAGISQFYALIAGLLPEEWAHLPPGEAARRVKVGIETERGWWVAALVAAGYEMFPVNPMSVARYRERHSTWGRSLTLRMPICWPRSSGWTGRITGRSPGTCRWLRRSS